jgi:hypothetical protein
MPPSSRYKCDKPYNSNAHYSSTLVPSWELYNNLDTVADIKNSRLEWIEHVASINHGGVVKKIFEGSTGTCFSPSTSVLPCQFHSTTGAPFLGKMKKTDNFSSSSLGCTRSLKAAVRP